MVGPCASFASPAPGRTRIGRDTHVRSTQRRNASPLRTPRRACTQRTQGARKHAEVARALRVVGPYTSFASPAPGRTRIGRDTHARSTQRRRASQLRTPRRACTQRTQGARKHAEVVRALRQPPPRPAISADPVGRRAPPMWSGRPPKLVTFIASNLLSTSVRVREQATHAQVVAY